MPPCGNGVDEPEGLDEGIGEPTKANLDAERAVLGAILLDNHALNAAREKLKSGDFFLSEHRRVFMAMLGMHEAGRAIDLVTLTDALTGRDEQEAAGGAPYLARLLDGVPRIVNVEHYARIVKEDVLLRNLAHAGNSIVEAVPGREPKKMGRRVLFERRGLEGFARRAHTSQSAKSSRKA